MKYICKTNLKEIYNRWNFVEKDIKNSEFKFANWN